MSTIHFRRIPTRLIGIIFILLSIGAVSENVITADVAREIEIAKHATVGILKFDPDSENIAIKTHFSVRGTGVHLHDGYILTARHAVERTEGGKRIIPKEVSILTDTLEELPATFIGVNAFLDIAVYRINAKENSLGLKPIPFEEEEPQPGQEVFTVGYPLGWGPAIMFGRVGNPNTFLPTANARLMQLDLSTCSGNSAVDFLIRGVRSLGLSTPSFKLKASNPIAAAAILPLRYQVI